MASKKSNSAKSSNGRKKSVIREYIELILSAILIALVVRVLIIEAYKIPTESMVPSLIKDDHLLVNKFVYGVKIPITGWKLPAITNPENGEVVVFQNPRYVSPGWELEFLNLITFGQLELDNTQSNPKNFIKRTIGTPGDTIIYTNHQITLNGEDLPVRPDYISEYDARMEVLNGFSESEEYIREIQSYVETKLNEYNQWMHDLLSNVEIYQNNNALSIELANNLEDFQVQIKEYYQNLMELSGIAKTEVNRIEDFKANILKPMEDRIEELGTIIIGNMQKPYNSDTQQEIYIENELESMYEMIEDEFKKRKDFIAVQMYSNLMTYAEDFLMANENSRMTAQAIYNQSNDYEHILLNKVNLLRQKKNNAQGVDKESLEFLINNYMEFYNQYLNQLPKGIFTEILSEYLNSQYLERYGDNFYLMNRNHYLSFSSLYNFPGEDLYNKIKEYDYYIETQLNGESYVIQYNSANITRNIREELYIAKEGDILRIVVDESTPSSMNNISISILQDPSIPKRYFINDTEMEENLWEKYYFNTLSPQTVSSLNDQLTQNKEATFTFDCDYYLMMGDNRDNSSDSRVWGLLRDDEIIGSALFIYYPFSRVGIIE